MDMLLVVVFSVLFFIVILAMIILLILEGKELIECKESQRKIQKEISQLIDSM